MDTNKIIDRGRRLGNFDETSVGYRVDLVKEELMREHLFARPGAGLTFLDVGGGDGELAYLLGMAANLDFSQERYDRNKAAFDAKFVYHCVDLSPGPSNALVGDICDPGFVDGHAAFCGRFDVVYSNNTFEHLRRPWIAARNIAEMTKPGALVMVTAPFSLRYHEVPADYFRYTHSGLASLFEDVGLKTLVCGYDIAGRRNNWQGGGKHNDICPVDEFGAWRENWFTVLIALKP